MGLDGLLAEEQLAGDLRVGPAVDDQPRDLQLALGQRLHAVAVRPAGPGPAVHVAVPEPAQLALGRVAVAERAVRVELGGRAVQLGGRALLIAGRRQRAPRERARERALDRGADRAGGLG